MMKAPAAVIASSSAAFASGSSNIHRCRASAPSPKASSRHKLPAPGGPDTWLAYGLHALRKHGLVEVLNVIDLDVEEEAGSLGWKLGLLPQLGVILAISRDEGHEEPVHVERHAIRLILASPEADGHVELGCPGEVLYVTGDPGVLFTFISSSSLGPGCLTASALRTLRWRTRRPAPAAGGPVTGRAPRFCLRPE